jgi:pilus assembly protein Flp/PilA
MVDGLAAARVGLCGTREGRITPGIAPFQETQVVTKLMPIVRKFLGRPEGATMVEYALMLALIAVVCLVAVSQVGTGANSTYNSVAASL